MDTAGLAKAADVSRVEAPGRDDEVGELVETVMSMACTGHSTGEDTEYVTATSGEVSGTCDRTSAGDDRSARRALLEQLSRQCGSEEEFDVARSRPTWTEVAPSSSSAGGPSSGDLEVVRIENRLLFQRLKAKSASRYLLELSLLLELIAGQDILSWSRAIGRLPFFWDFGDRLSVGRRIGGGGQAEIYEALYDGQVTPFVLKVFRIGCSLSDLQRIWATELLNSMRERGKAPTIPSCVCIANGTLLKDGRFAFVMKRYWGDLRKLIDLQIVKDMNTHQNPPFPLPIAVWIMIQIATGMRGLHLQGILHRDLKAANVLLEKDVEKYIRNEKVKLHRASILIADFETPEGVMGTGFWRAPEILHALKHRTKNMHLDSKIWTEKIDVYSYAMTCYEILTGCIPFQNGVANVFDGVIRGERPPLPDYVDPEIQELVRRCWHSEPSMRPTFGEIVPELRRFIIRRREISARLPEDGKDAEAMQWLDEESFRYQTDDAER